MSELPPGFVLDAPAPAEGGEPALPEGFVLDTAAPPAAAKKQFGLADTWPARLAKQAYQAVRLPGDVAQGNVPIFGENGRTNPEVINRAADLAAISSPMNPAVRAGDRVIAGVSRQTPYTGVPTSNAIRQAADDLYKSPEISGLQIQPEALTRFSQAASSKLNTIGVDENLAPKTFGVLGDAGTVPQGAIGVSGQNLESLRRTLGTAARSADPTERMAATHAINALDDFVATLPQKELMSGDAAAASQVWEQARANYGAAMRSGKISKAVDKAELQAASTGSGANIDNALRQQIKSILNSENKVRGFSPEEVAAMRQIVEGTPVANTARLVGKLAPTGVVSAALSAGSGFAASGGNPLGAVALPMVGLASKAIADRLTQKQVARLDELVRSRSPFAKAIASSSSKWERAADALASDPSSAKLAAFLLASRNLSNTFNGAGISIPVRDFIRALQSPKNTTAEENEPEIPR